MITRRQFNIQLNLLHALVLMSLQKSVNSFSYCGARLLQIASGWKFLRLALSQATFSATGRKDRGMYVHAGVGRGMVAEGLED